MIYRIKTRDGKLSPAPDEVWYTKWGADAGLDYWKRQHPELDLVIVEETNGEQIRS